LVLEKTLRVVHPPFSILHSRVFISLNPQLSTITISWPYPSTGWTLQENTNSVSSANWNDHPFPQDNGTIKYIIVNPPTGNRFYRLKK
jgi:hypothetical protein